MEADDARPVRYAVAAMGLETHELTGKQLLKPRSLRHHLANPAAVPVAVELRHSGLYPARVNVIGLARLPHHHARGHVGRPEKVAQGRKRPPVSGHVIERADDDRIQIEIQTAAL